MQTRRTFGLAALAVLIEAPLVWLGAQSHLSLLIVETTGVLLATSIFYIVSVWLLLKTERGRSRTLFLWTQLAALVFRLTLFPLHPAFSEDLYRYRWEGKIQAHGFNPYVLPPDHPDLAHLRDEIYPRIGNPELPAVYGPLIELQQHALYRMVASVVDDPARQLFWFKSAGALADVGVIGAIALLLWRRGLPLERVLIYSWCPLPVFEFWATGHNDSILLLFVVLALAGAAAGRRGWAVFALSLAAMTKFWPALMLPSLTGWRLRRMAAGAMLMAAVGAVLWLPYRADLTGNVQLTSGFLGGWRNNDSLHTIVAALAPDRYIAKYVTIALIVSAAILISRLRWTLEARALALVVALLALSANVHPWYLTWLVPLLVFYPLPALLLWTALMPLTYAVRLDWEILGEWNGTTGWRWLVYIPVLLMAAGGWWIRRINR
jgi:hypothetical protein